MPSTETDPQIVEEAIIESIAYLGAPRADIKREATFEELDLDSLDLVEIAQMAEEKWGASLEPQDLGGVKTVGEAIDLVIARLP
ncbi:MAG TPA: phosphopantetheine-binding protein [Thermoleophilaceae bacterium]